MALLITAWGNASHSMVKEDLKTPYGFFQFYGVFKSFSAVNISLQSAPNAVIDWIKISLR